MTRAWLLLIACAVTLCGCGSSHPLPASVALVDGQPISTTELQDYVNYSTRFYAWKTTGGGQAGVLQCPAGASGFACTRVRQEALARLIEERVVLAYAQAHQITLSVGDRRRINTQLARIVPEGAKRAQLLRQLGVGLAFLRDILTRQILIQKVELGLVAHDARSGPAFHLRKFTVPFADSQGQVAAHQQALDLATDGRPVPVDAHVQVEWIASFRLSTAMRNALLVAQPGQFIGPFAHATGYIVIQLLDRGQHTYGGPAQVARQDLHFRSWLRRMVGATPLRCFDTRHRAVACPPVDH